MGRKCSVLDCLSESSRKADAGVTFHKVPMHSDIRPKWISLCRIPEDKKNIKIIYVCSRHFLRADFCNFKGKKYMLRQGVLPSVFPWDKSKLEALKGEPKKDETELKQEKTESPETEPIKVKEEPDDQPPEPMEDLVAADVKIEQPEEPSAPEPPPEPKIDPEPPSVKIEKKGDDFMSSSSSLNFVVNSRLEALDVFNSWCPATIIEVDYEGNEVLIHFEKFSSKQDEWINMDSPRLRPLQPPSAKYAVGERVLAAWTDAKKFPATVSRILEDDTYEVLFDDGYVKNVKGHRMTKAQGKHMQASPLFDPIKTSKQERRDKKRKINVASLFNKRAKMDTTADKVKAESSPLPSGAPGEASPTLDDLPPLQVPIWENGRPVGIDSSIETHDGTRKSVIVADSRIPQGWTKHLVQRITGASAGKWDIIYLSPDGRRFRTRSEIRSYLEANPLPGFSEHYFDFSLHRQKHKKSEPRKKETIPEPEEEVAPAPAEPAHPLLKIEMVNNAYKCPIEGCGKNFRRENLAQMHVKHYHPEYTKFLDSTPNVADLAYARTVGENLDKSPGVAKQLLPRFPVKASTPKAKAEGEAAALSPSQAKDAEIIKLLNKPYEKKEDMVQPLPPGLPSNMYPDIKLKDLLTKSESMPKRDDINMKTLCSTRPPVGIKTLLPVRSAEQRDEPKPKRKKSGLEGEGFKGNSPLPDTLESTPPPAPHYETLQPLPTGANNIIIEGGEVIKIVRMKQEEIINCTCGFTEEDGLMIQCELCLCWQHAYCNNIERESQVPEKYICYICQNPVRERSSRKYFHDQDWLKQGALPSGSYHSKDEEALQKRFEKLRKSHDISGGIHELKDYLHTLSVRLKIAEVKNHPKLYLWSKPWEKPELPEKVEVKEEEKFKVEEAKEDKTESMLLMMLKSGKEEEQTGPIIPKPEAAINSEDCRLNLLQYIGQSQDLVEERLDEFERQIEMLEEGMNIENVENYPNTRHTLQMLLRDLATLKEFSQIPTI